MTDIQRLAEVISSSNKIVFFGGTSLAVQPAASFVGYFGGDCTVIINKESTPYDKMAELVFHSSLAEVFGQVAELI